MAEFPTSAAASSPTDTPIMRSFPPLSRNRNFGLLWLGYVVSALGDRLHFLVMLDILCIRILHQKHYGAQQSAQLNIAMFLPFFLLGPIAGLIADRVPRRWIMVVSDSVRVVVVLIARTVVLAYAARADANVPLLLAMLFGSEFIVSIFGAAFSPARTALLPNIVHPDQLLRANSLTTAAGTIFSLVGYIVGSALLTLGLRFAVYGDACTYFLSAVFILAMRVPSDAARGTGAQSLHSVASEFRQGLRYLRTHRRAMQIIALELVFWISSMVALNSVTAIVSNEFNMTKDLGYFLGVAGLGMVCGALLLSSLRNGISKEAGIAWALLLTGVFLFCLGLTHWWPIFLAFLILGSFAGAIALITLETLLQKTVPDYVRGRVMGVRDLVTNAGMIISAVPMAVSAGIDTHIHGMMMATGAGVVVVGIGIVVYYYRRQTLPLPVAIARRLGKFMLEALHRYQRVGACTIPGQGPVIVIANHTCSLDPLTVQVGSPRRLVHFMMAREYYEIPVIHLFFKYLGSIPVNRSGNDIASVRAALRLLKDGKVLGVFPEGRISLDGRLNEARQGTAVLALKSGATVVPAYISGTRPHASVLKDMILPARMAIRFGPPMRFDHLKGRERDRDALTEVTAKMMAAIGALAIRAGDGGRAGVANAADAAGSPARGEPALAGSVAEPHVNI